jgi:hypothetical protein
MNRTKTRRRLTYRAVDRTFARWLSWREPSPSNVSHRQVTASRKPSAPSSSA